MVTPQQMRDFALECLRWSEQTEDASQRDIMVQLAKTWMHAANKIDCHVIASGETFADLHRKLD
jgi:predicted YcjX-like family ATPase